MTEQSPILNRLESLPAKIAAPFRELLQRGHITEPLLETILNAGDISEDRSKLLGFAIGYLNLRQNGVPITDVISMSMQLGRKVRLDWSPNRWKHEHDRLSRALALSRLSEENVRYDVSRYEPLVPRRFPGYLIRTSRRLGMEGLRQRHCVASYHQKLINKYCALASVFVDGTRWTVQLHLTGKPDQPLRISQVRTRLNQLPDRSTTEAINDIFGIEEAAPSHMTSEFFRRPSRPSVYFDNLQRILPVLRAQQVKQVIAPFDGYGDSGSIDDVGFDPEIAADSINVTILRGTQQLDNNEWVPVYEDQQVNLSSAIEDLIYEYLEETSPGWEINDGSFGEFRIDVDKGSVFLEVNNRFTDSTCAYMAERDIETGDVLTGRH